MGITNSNGAMFWATGIDNTGLRAGRQEAMGILQSMTRNITGMDVFAGLGISAGIAFTRIIKESRNFSQEFQMSMKEVETISDAVKADYEGISDSIIQLSTEGPDGAIKLSKAYYQIVSAGYDGAKGLQLLEASSKAATAGLTETKTSADALTTVMNAWGYSADQAEQITDIFFQTVKKGKTTFGELASSISQVAPLASAMGISFEEIMAAIATLTKQGAPTAMAITQIRSALIGMSETLGDGWAKTMTFQEGLAKVREMAGGSQTKLKDMIGRIEGVNAVLGLTGDKAKMAAEDLRSMGEAAGAGADAFDVMMEADENLWKRIGNKYKAIGKKIGDLIIEGINESGISSFIEKLADGILADMGKIRDNWYKKSMDEVNQLVAQAATVDEARALIIEKNNDLYHKQIRLQDDLKKAEEERPSKFARTFTILSDSQREAEANYQVISADLNNTIKLRDRLEKLVKDKKAFDAYFDELRKKPEKNPDPKGGGAGSDISRTYKDIEQDIKNVKEQMETASKSQYEIFARRLKALQKEKKAWDDIADAIMNTQEVMQPKQPTGVRATNAEDYLNARAKIFKARDKGILSPDEADKMIDKLFAQEKKVSDTANQSGLELDKLLTKAAKAGSDARKMEGDITDEKKKQNKETREHLILMDNVLYSLSMMVSKYSEALGLTEDQTMAIQAGMQAMSGITDLASGNIPQGVTKIVDSMLTVFLKADEKLADHYNRVRDNINKMIDSINVANQALENIGSNNIQAALNLIDSQFQQIKQDADKLFNTLDGNVSQRRNANGGTYSTAINQYKELNKQVGDLEENIVELSKRLLSTSISDDQRAAVEAVLQSYNDLVAEMENITQRLTGTTVKDFSESLAAVFIDDGIDAAEKWGAKVNEIIRTMIIKQLSAELLAKPIREAINKLLSDSADGLNPSEAKDFGDTIASIAQQFGPAFEEARKALDALGIDISSTTDSANSAVGKISRAITEDSATELIGLWNRTSLDIRGQLILIRESVEIQRHIEANTLRTANNTDQLKSIYTEVVSLKNSMSNRRDLGY